MTANKAPDLDLPVPATSFRCACGCDLRLSRREYLDAVRLLHQAGPERHAVSLRPSPGTSARARAAAPEPTVARWCPACGQAEVAVPTWGAEFLARWGAAWPVCGTCRERNY